MATLSVSPAAPLTLDDHLNLINEVLFDDLIAFQRQVSFLFSPEPNPRTTIIPVAKILANHKTLDYLIPGTWKNPASAIENQPGLVAIAESLKFFVKGTQCFIGTEEDNLIRSFSATVSRKGCRRFMAQATPSSTGLSLHIKYYPPTY